VPDLTAMQSGASTTQAALIDDHKAHLARAAGRNPAPTRADLRRAKPPAHELDGDEQRALALATWLDGVEADA
jgi:hypothetical protein